MVEDKTMGEKQKRKKTMCRASHAHATSSILHIQIVGYPSEFTCRPWDWHCPIVQTEVDGSITGPYPEPLTR